MITYPNLYHLKYFVDAVALGSISGAAQKNLVTHPAISRAISSLEKHLGVDLLEHQKKSFKVTKMGQVVSEQALVLLAAASDFEKRSLKFNADKAVTLKVGISRTLADTYLSSLLKSVKEKFPNTKAQIRFGTTSEIIEAVAKGSVDLGLTIGSQNLSTLKQTPVTQGQFVLVQCGTKTKGRESLEGKSFILTEPRPETEKLKTGYQKQYGKTLSVLFEVSSWESISQLVQKGMGIGLVPEI